MLSRKDYIKIARVIKNSNKDFETLKGGLMDYFKVDNPRFNQEKFLKAIE